MNQYQKHLMCNNPRNVYSLRSSLGDQTLDQSALENDTIVLKQREDITCKDYLLYFSNAAIEAIFAIKGAKQIPFEKADAKKNGSNSSLFAIDFDKKIDSVRIVFKNGLADDLILRVIYEEADKEAYYKKIEQERQEALQTERLSKAAVQYATGASLVNIYFQPCCEEHVRTEIILYRFMNSQSQMLATYKVPEDSFFKSIEGLAYGWYGFVLKQYDKNNELLLETKQFSFEIREPSGERYVRI